MSRTLFRGADLVLPDRITSGRTLVIEGDEIVDLAEDRQTSSLPDRVVDCTHRIIVPGFIDVHVHGNEGTDALDGAGSIARMARAVPKWGVTAFCPTSIACAPRTLETFLNEVAGLRRSWAPQSGTARVLPAHLESNFISPEFCGAQPTACLRSAVIDQSGSTAEPFSGRDIVATIDRHRPDVAIVTMAPEIDGGIQLLKSFVAAGVYVSVGHSGATFEEAQEAFAAGAKHATHLFNRMRGATHRDPGLVGAVLAGDDVAAELICDGHHVHSAMMRMAIKTKSTAKIMAITDGTAGAGLPRGSTARLGGQQITVDDVARLHDGTIAGSVLTMDRAFARLVVDVGLDPVQASHLCSTTPARQLGLTRHGTLTPGAKADFVVLDRDLRVVQTWIGGTPWAADSSR